MIRIQIWRRATGSIDRFRLEGHSGYAPLGQDIVCAAVSALAQTAVLGLMSVVQMDVEVEVDADIGLLDCRIPRADRGSDATLDQQAAILETMVLGLREIEAQYPQYVTIKEMTTDR